MLLEETLRKAAIPDTSTAGPSNREHNLPD
jgi:hypothetical protein